MKEAFVFPSLCELLNRPRHHSAHTDISDNTRAGKHQGVGGWGGGGGREVTVEKIRPAPSSSGLETEVRDSDHVERGGKKKRLTRTS